jgi:hypothetical protein
MPTFATDRDLLALEPTVFRDAGWTSQRLVAGVADLSGTALTFTSQDATLAAAGVTTGHVVLFDAVPLEVISRTSNTVLQVSRLRASTDDAAIPPTPASAKPALVYTFGPQIALAHRQLLCMLGIDPDADSAPGVLSEASITNPAMLRRAECLAALHLIYSALAAVGGPDSVPGRRADFYRAQLAIERQLAVAQLDTDGDSLPDATRRLNVIQFIRA